MVRTGHLRPSREGGFELGIRNSCHYCSVVDGWCMMNDVIQNHAVLHPDVPDEGVPVNLVNSMAGAGSAVEGL